MNMVILIGRLTRDPDVRYLSDGKAVAKFTLAVDRAKSGENGTREADFISCVAFNKTAEFFEKYTGQGSKVAINGRIQTGSYTNRDNQKVYTTDVIVNGAEFAESKQKPSNSSGQQAEKKTPKEEPPMNAGFMNIPDGVEDEGLPFN